MLSQGRGYKWTSHTGPARIHHGRAADMSPHSVHQQAPKVPETEIMDDILIQVQIRARGSHAVQDVLCRRGQVVGTWIVTHPRVGGQT